MSSSYVKAGCGLKSVGTTGLVQCKAGEDVLSFSHLSDQWLLTLFPSGSTHTSFIGLCEGPIMATCILQWILSRGSDIYTHIWHNFADCFLTVDTFLFVFFLRQPFSMGIIMRGRCRSPVWAWGGHDNMGASSQICPYILCFVLNQRCGIRSDSGSKCLIFCLYQL